MEMYSLTEVQRQGLAGLEMWKGTSNPTSKAEQKILLVFLLLMGAPAETLPFPASQFLNVSIQTMVICFCRLRICSIHFRRHIKAQRIFSEPGNTPENGITGCDSSPRRLGPTTTTTVTAFSTWETGLLTYFQEGTSCSLSSLHSSGEETSHTFLPSLLLTRSFCKGAAWAVPWLDLEFSPVGDQLFCPRLCVASLRPIFLPTELSGPGGSGKGGGGARAARAAHLLGGGQAVLCSAQDAADEAELLQGELGHF